MLGHLTENSWSWIMMLNFWHESAIARYTLFLSENTSYSAIFEIKFETNEAMTIIQDNSVPRQNIITS